VLIILLFATGILLKFTYDPFPGQAYDSIIRLQNELLFGRLIRNIHHWSANFLIGVLFLHSLRVFFSGGFYPPRQLNWLFGLILFVCSLVSNFTGYLLPWDQLSYWAITICTAMIDYIPLVGTGLRRMIQGGIDIGPVTLRIFYTFHTVVIPAVLVFIMGLHFWYIRKAGGVVVPLRPGDDPASVKKPVSSGLDLLTKELVSALVVIGFILLFSALVDAPLGDKANPGLSPNPAKAPWYFAGLQELLLLFHPVLAILIAPAMVCGALVSLPYLNYDSDTSGVWFCSVKGRQLTTISIGGTLVFAPLGIVCMEFFVKTSIYSGFNSSLISQGIVPMLVGITSLAGYYVILKKWVSASKNEAIQSVFVVLLFSFIVLTVSGIWFRGEGMTLVWP